MAKRTLKIVPAEIPQCQWFALCDNPAVTTRGHPILKEVPICARCNLKIQKIMESTNAR